MEKNQYDLCLEVLRRMKSEGILDKVMIVGSWCVLLYDDYFKGKGLLPAIRTRDIEFLIPIPLSLGRKTDLPALLKDLGFIVDHKGEQGYIIFQHPELILEFLVPDRGKGIDKPFLINQLGINAQALRFMDFLAQDPIKMPFQDIEVTVPHPANFALQKLLIAKRRKQEGKAEKDRAQAVAILTALNDSGDFKTVCSRYQATPKTWQNTIKQELTALHEDDLLAFIEKA